jgi:hypothetical protein
MGETEDPRAALRSDDVAIRTAGARDLATRGSLDDGMVLLDLAIGDRSPSVRLYAAAAAAEILLRSEPARAEQVRILDRLKAFDPGYNPALLMVLAATPDADGIERLGRLLRDPRSDVRSGAQAALKRLAVRSPDDPRVADAVRAWLLAGRHPPDAVAELVRLASESGWLGMDDAFHAAASRGRAAQVAVQEALDWSVSRRDPASWVGLWVAVDDDQNVLDWLYLESGRAWGPEGELGALRVEDGVGTVAGRGPLVRVRLGRSTEDGPSEAIRQSERSLWRQTPKMLAKRTDSLEPILVACAPAALGVARELAPLEGAGAVRGRILALWRAGALSEAEHVLDAIAASEKKLKPDLQWLCANVKLGLGDLDSAREQLRGCLKTGPKKAVWRDEAEALLGSLGG